MANPIEDLGANNAQATTARNLYDEAYGDFDEGNEALIGGQEGPRAEMTTEDSIRRTRDVVSRLPGVSDQDRQVVAEMASLILQGNQDSIDRLNQFCQSFNNNPTELLRHFTNMRAVLAGLGIQTPELQQVLNPDRSLAAVSLDLPTSGNNFLRLASRPGLGGFVVTRSTVFNPDGTEVPVEHILQQNSPYGAALAVRRLLRSALSR